MEEKDEENTSAPDPNQVLKPESQGKLQGRFLNFKKKFFLPSLLFIIFLLLIFGGLFLYKEKFTKNQAGETKVTNDKGSLRSSSEVVHLIRLSPNKGPIGTLVNIEGTGFTNDYNLILFGSNSTVDKNGIPNNLIASTHVYPIEQFQHSSSTPSNANVLEFFIPGAPGLTDDAEKVCLETNNCISPKSLKIQKASPGTYEVSVKNKNGTSNKLKFSVIDVSNGPSSKVFTEGKTYIDPNYKFSIDYPYEIKYDAFPDPEKEDVYTLEIYMDKEKEPFSPSLRISFEENPQKLSPTEYIRNEEFKNDIPEYKNNELPIKKLDMSGITAVEVDNIQTATGATLSMVYIFKNDFIIKIENEGTFSDLERKVISTFKFID